MRKTQRSGDYCGEERERCGPYRSRSGAIMGVCKGLAQHFGWSLFWTRFVVVAVALILGIWPVVIAYLIAGFIMKPEPVVPFSNEMDQEFYTSFTASRHTALARVKKTYDNLERRLRRLEDSVTAREFDWDRRFREGQ